MLKHLMICTIFTAGSLSGYAIPEPLRGDKIPDYTDHYIKTLFGAQREQPRENREFLRELGREAIRATAPCREYWFFLPTDSFDRSCVEEAIRSTTCEYIIRKAREIARGYTSDVRTVETVCQKIRDDLYNIFTGRGDLNGSLRDYFGNERIRDRVWRAKEEHDHKKREEAKRKATPEMRCFPSEECCICYNELATVGRIFLHPCGHDLCLRCARDMASRSREMSCPQCRALVTNREALL